MKHRTQILLEPGQYDFMKSLAARMGVSLGKILRQWIEEKRQALARPSGKDPLSSLIGCIRDKECHSENYEEFLYGKNRA